ncbi:MAG: MotE family protein [Rhodomicrobiaceae bacterium]
MKLRNYPGFLLRSAGCACLLMTVQAAPTLAESNPKAWGTNVESEAEFAYRSVYQRSLDAAKEEKAAPRQAARRKPAGRLAASIPLPVRKPVQASETTSAMGQVGDKGERTETKGIAPVEFVTSTATPSASPAPDVPGTHESPDRIPETFGSLPTTPWFNPILAGADSMLTTQVTGSEDAAREIRSEPVPSTRGDQYCSNIASAAADARFAWQRQTLLETEEQVRKRIEALQAQIADYQKWLARRDEFSKKAQAAVTDIYSKMRPDAAAQQLMVLDEETAAAVISQLNPRNASAVMAEMRPNEAARLTAIISASSKGPRGKPPVQPEGGGT